MLLGEAVRKSILGLGMEHTGTKFGVVTVSVGVATMAPGSTVAHHEDLTATADAALYVAKAGGRNRTTFAAPGAPAGPRLAASA